MLGAIVHWDHKPTLAHEGLRYAYQMFDYAARAYNVDKLVFVDLTHTLEVLQPPEDIVDTLEEALALFPQDHTFHYLDKSGEQILLGYVHPVDSVYVIGPDYTSFTVPEGASTFRIDMANNEMELWASQVLGMVFAHRFAVLSQ